MATNKRNIFIFATLMSALFIIGWLLDEIPIMNSHIFPEIFLMFYLGRYYREKNVPVNEFIGACAALILFETWFLYIVNAFQTIQFIILGGLIVALGFGRFVKPATTTTKNDCIQSEKG